MTDEIAKRVARIIANGKKLRAKASRELLAAGGWRESPPNSPGIWVHAYWQKAGFWHHQINRQSIRTMRQAAKETTTHQRWAGPFSPAEGKDKWLSYLPSPEAP